MSGRRRNKLAMEPYSFPTTPSTYSFLVPRAGYWKFVGWGAGGKGNAGVSGGASGAYFESTRFLPRGAAVSVAVPTTGDTVITFPDGKVVTAGAATFGVAGAAFGGDLNLAGTAGMASGGSPGAAGQGTGGGGGGAGAGASGGAGAPANLPYRGGAGGGSGEQPGVGAGATENSNAQVGPGLVLAVYLRS